MARARTRRYYRPRRSGIRRVYLMRRPRFRRKHVSLFDILGLGVGLGLSAFGPNGSDPQYFASDPVGQTKYAVNGIISGITGYNPAVKQWSISNMADFYLPLIGFHIAGWVAKKMGLEHVKVYRNIKLG
ncbi:MAG: hypothetical protein QXV17_12560 [Candidatus Micrarchaeaceae archaeon]